MNLEDVRLVNGELPVGFDVERAVEILSVALVPDSRGRWALAAGFLPEVSGEMSPCERAKVSKLLDRLHRELWPVVLRAARKMASGDLGEISRPS